MTACVIKAGGSGGCSGVWRFVRRQQLVDFHERTVWKAREPVPVPFEVRWEAFDRHADVSVELFEQVIVELAGHLEAVELGSHDEAVIRLSEVPASFKFVDVLVQVFELIRECLSFVCRRPNWRDSQ